jgi:hypothetical protein
MLDEIGTAIKTSSDLLYSTLALEDRKSLSFNSNKYSLSLLLLFHFNSTITLILQLFNLYSIFYWKIISRKFYFIEQIVDWFENTFIYFNDKYISEKIIQNHMNSAQKVFIDYWEVIWFDFGMDSIDIIVEVVVSQNNLLLIRND